MWSLDNKSLIRCFAAHEKSVVDFRYNKYYLVSGGYDGNVRTWDLRTGCLVREVDDKASFVYKLGFGGGKLVTLVGRPDKKILLEMHEFEESHSKP